MKVGLIARCEDRGLGIQTWEWARAMRPDRVLIVDGSTHTPAFPQHPERFENATVVRLDDGWPERATRAWLEGLDVVYSVETLYDWRIADWARQQGVATVVHGNPEFYRHHREPLAHPSAWWAPTSWRRTHYPPGTIVMPVPVPLDRWPQPIAAPPTDPPTWLHVVGHRAMADRNGTLLLLQALRHVRHEHRVVLRTQDARLPAMSRMPRWVHVERHGATGDYWDLYGDAAALLMPRRYGGLSLPVLEASGAGMAIVMSDTVPQAFDWPHVELVETVTGARPIEAQTGRLPLANVVPEQLARLMDEWATDPAAILDRQVAARDWATAHSWDLLRARYVTALEQVVDAC